jgi:hypothetical protein
MADWTSGFTAFREGMGQLAAGRERRRQQDLEKDRLKREDERLGLERDRAEREKKAFELDLQLKNRRLKRPAPTAPEGFRQSGVEFDEFGNPNPKFERIPEVFDTNKHVISMGRDRVILDPSTGRPAQVVKGNWWDSMPGAAPDAGAGPSATPDAGPAAGPVTPAKSPFEGFEMTGISSEGPTFQRRLNLTPPQIVTREVGGGLPPQRFIESTDPKTGEIKLSPYNVPEAATKISDKTVAQQNFDAATRYADELTKIIDRSDTYETRFGNTADSAALEQIPYLMAISMAKILDPGSVAREGEVAAAKKYLVPLGPMADANVAKAAIARLKNDLAERAKGLGLNTGQPAGQAATPAAPDAVRVSSKEQYDTLPSGTVYIDDSGNQKRKP